ncbi:MAG: hypothetical protein IPG61_03220 [bacterium]|nr:hypothetical protein [bacterium]
MMASGGSKAGSGRGRRVIIVLSLLTAFGSVVAFVAPRLVPSARVAARAQEALAAATGAEVTVGSASLTLFGGPGLRLRETRLVSAGGSTARFAELEFSLAVAPLLRRELVVDRVAARGPSARAMWRGLPVDLADFELETGRLRLRLPREGDTAAMVAPAAAEGPLSRLPAGLAGSFSLEAARVAWSSFALETLNAEGSIEEGRISFENLDAGCGGGRLKASAVITPVAGATGALTGNLVLEAVDAAALLGAWAPAVASQMDVKLTGDADVGMPLGGDGGLDALTAAAHLTTGEGLLRAGPWLGDVGPYLGDRQDLVDIRIATSRLAVRLEEGRCLVDTLVITGPDTDWDLAGALGLGGVAGSTTAMDLAVHIKLPPGFTPNLGSMSFFAEAMRDRERRINLDLRLTGPVDGPDVTLDLAAMSRRARR